MNMEWGKGRERERGREREKEREKKERKWGRRLGLGKRGFILLLIREKIFEGER